MKLVSKGNCATRNKIEEIDKWEEMLNLINLIYLKATMICVKKMNIDSSGSKG
jgi:hypothetical protein